MRAVFCHLSLLMYMHVYASVSVFIFYLSIYLSSFPFYFAGVYTLSLFPCLQSGLSYVLYSATVTGRYNVGQLLTSPSNIRWKVEKMKKKGRTCDFGKQSPWWIDRHVHKCIHTKRKNKERYVDENEYRKSVIFSFERTWRK